MMKTRLFAIIMLLGIAVASMLMPPALPAGPETSTGRNVYPNPFVDKTTFTLTMSSSADVRITVHDIMGKPVRVLREGPQPAGTFDIVWDGRDNIGDPVAPGIYICSLFTQNQLVNSVKVVKAEA